MEPGAFEAVLRAYLLCVFVYDIESFRFYGNICSEGNTIDIGKADWILYVPSYAKFYR